MTAVVLDLATGRPLAPPAERGRTTVSDRAVAMTAELAALDVDGACAAPSRLRRGPSRPRATARVDGRVVRLALQLGVHYPSPVAATTRAVREHLVREVGRICDVDVREVDLEVTVLTRERPRRRVL